MRSGELTLHEETTMQADAREVLEAFRLYTQAFQALDARAVAQQFHEPAFFITPKDVRALPTRAAVEQTYVQVMADMPPDYARTEFGPLSVTRLGDDLAMVSGSGSWKNAANADLMPFGMTYTLRRTGQTWRIAVAAIHAADGRLDDSHASRS
jgi:ketosteroid isomerase-like protein